MSTTLFKLDENTKNLKQEISALSGYAQSIVQECYEYLLVDWAIKISESLEKGEDIKLTVPYLGQIAIKYTGDSILPTGELETNLSAEVEFTPGFKKLVGDIEDQGYTEIVPLITKKIENAVMVASAD